MKKIITIIFSLLFLLGTNNFHSSFVLHANNVVATPYVGETVEITDSNLKAEINRLLGKSSTDTITIDEIKTITSISLYATSPVADLTGLEYAENLEYLYVRDFTGTDISAIANLPKLRNLNLAGDNLEHLPNLNNLTTLTHLTLSVPISDQEFTQINQLPLLEFLYLDQNMRITDISLLAELPNLRALSVQFCGITDFTIIPNFPSLVNLMAYGQNTGRYSPEVVIQASDLDYDIDNETLFIPFSSLPNRLTNFDGEQSPLSTSNSWSNTYFDFNDVQLPAERIQINAQGITILNVTATEFFSIDTFTYNTRYTWRAGDFQSPAGYSFYAVSGGTYLQDFRIDHSILITADQVIRYPVNTALTELEFFTDIHAQTNDGSAITSDFLSNVDFSTPGTYQVTLNAENRLGKRATPVTITVIVEADGETTDNNEESSNNNEESSNNNEESSNNNEESSNNNEESSNNNEESSNNNEESSNNNEESSNNNEESSGIIEDSTDNNDTSDSTNNNQSTLPKTGMSPIQSYLIILSSSILSLSIVILIIKFKRKHS